MILDVQCQQENPNPQVHQSSGKLINPYFLLRNGETSGWDFPVSTEHQCWILFVLFWDRSKYIVKPVLSGHSKIDKTKTLMTNDSLMKVESIAECSTWTILQYF